MRFLDKNDFKAWTLKNGETILNKRYVGNIDYLYANPKYNRPLLKDAGKRLDFNTHHRD